MEMMAWKVKAGIASEQMNLILEANVVPPYWKFWAYYTLFTVALWSLSYSVYLWTNVLMNEEWGMAVSPAAIVVAYIVGVAKINQIILDGYQEGFTNRVTGAAGAGFDYELVAMYEPVIRKKKLFRLFGYPVTLYHCGAVFATAFVIPTLVKLFQFLFA